MTVIQLYEFIFDFYYFFLGGNVRVICNDRETVT